jgi:thymidylate synthase (FAD)
MNVKLIQASDESVMAYCARVSNPDNQYNPDYSKLFKYCYSKGHWSIFEMGDMTVEITTSRAVAAQLLRHRSFCFQEFSQRYSQVPMEFQQLKARRQDLKNRQNSTDDLDEDAVIEFAAYQQKVQDVCETYYKMALSIGVAKEQARYLLPLSVQTRLYMKGSVRSWIHYLQQRLAPETQQEHREVAKEIEQVFRQAFPTVGNLI